MPIVSATKYNRWYTHCRECLFQTLQYVDVSSFCTAYVIPKFSTEKECGINAKLLRTDSILGARFSKMGSQEVYYRSAGGGYFLLIKNRKSETYIDGVLEDVKAEKSITISRATKKDIVGAVLSSTLFYWNYIGYTDCRNLSKSAIENFKCPTSCYQDSVLEQVGKRLFKDYEKNCVKKDTYYKSTGRNVVFFEYYPKLSKPIIDEIDKVLAKHYGFTEEELDFIINYDIKYRMGDGLNGEE